MIAQSNQELQIRAEGFALRLRGVRAEILAGSSLIGGGATPEQPLRTWLVTVHCADVVETERRCRFSDPPVIARIDDNRLLLDLRTVFPSEEEELARVILEACS
jgi:L-seryl-tRNA(Ser) seleniumtransferase